MIATTLLAYAPTFSNAQSYYMLEEFGSESEFSYTVTYSNNASFSKNGGRLWRFGMTIHFTNETDATLHDVRFVLTGVQAAYRRNDNTFHTTSLLLDPDTNRFIGNNSLLTSPYDGNPDNHSAWFNLFDSSSFLNTGMPLDETGIPGNYLRLDDSEIPTAPLSWELDVSDDDNPSLDTDITYPYLVLGDIASGQTISTPSFYLRIEQPQGFTNDAWTHVNGRLLAASSVPEPSSALLSGMLGSLVLRRRKRSA